MPHRAKEVYPSDSGDAQWSMVAPVLRAAFGRSGRLPQMWREQEGLSQKNLRTTIRAEPRLGCTANLRGYADSDCAPESKVVHTAGSKQRSLSLGVPGASDRWSNSTPPSATTRLEATYRERPCRQFDLSILLHQICG